MTETVTLKAIRQKIKATRAKLAALEAAEAQLEANKPAPQTPAGKSVEYRTMALARMLRQHGPKSVAQCRGFFDATAQEMAEILKSPYFTCANRLESLMCRSGEISLTPSGLAWIDGIDREAARDAGVRT